MNELSTEVLENSSSDFVAPHYIEELGCEGLTAGEIAASLGTHVDIVRRKLREGDYDKISLSGLKLFRSRMKNINGVEYEEFFLSTAVAKFFVARYCNEYGDAYMLYLIGIEMIVDTLCLKLRARGMSFADVDMLIETYNKVPLLEGSVAQLTAERNELQQYKEEVEKVARSPLTKNQIGALLDLVNWRGNQFKPRGVRRLCLMISYLNDVLYCWQLPQCEFEDVMNLVRWGCEKTYNEHWDSRDERHNMYKHLARKEHEAREAGSYLAHRNAYYPDCDGTEKARRRFYDI